MIARHAPLGKDAAHRLLGRAAYGARPGEAAAVSRMGLSDWLDAQLALPAQDVAAEAFLANMTLRVRREGASADEQLPLDTYRAPQAQNWVRSDYRIRMPGTERVRPWQETAVATVARKVLADAQLRERVVEFWHDHFSVNADASPGVLVSIPEHDRRIRAHALGRFRDLLEAMTSSPAMLIYLSNASSRAGAPNENYARELLELHTLGATAYYGGSRQAMRVPGAAAGRPEGYTDGDVWEAARALTGWTVGSGEAERGGMAAASGDFTFSEQMHDPYQKRFLGMALEPFEPAMAHGRAVLDACAANPATARHVVGKLGRFLIGPDVPQACLARGIRAFQAQADQPDQLARVVRALLEGPEIIDPALGRLRRPLDLAAAGMRGLGLAPRIDMNLINAMDAAGQRLFGWPSPDGQPMAAQAYLDGTGMRARWGMVLRLAAGGFNSGASEVMAGLAGQAAGEVAAALSQHLLGAADAPAAGAMLQQWTAARRGPRPNMQEVGEMAGWLMAAPAFQST